MVQRVAFKDRSGKTRRSGKWYATFQDLAGRWKRIPGYTDRRLTDKLERNARKLVDLRQNRERPDTELAQWLDALPERVRVQLVKVGILDENRAAAGRALADHYQTFKAHLEAKGTTKTHVSGQVARVKAAMKGCHTLGDLDVETVRRFLASLRARGCSARTVNGHVQAVRQFTAWLQREGILGADPFQHLERTRNDAKKFQRRALIEEEALRLLTATKKEPTRYGMPGAERSLLYRLCLETGLRRNEVITLERRALNLEVTPSTIWVQSQYAKNRKDAYLPLREETAAALRQHVAKMLPGARVFGMAANHRTADMLREDLAAAKVEAENEDGRLDFHSLRHSMVTRLARSGVHPKVAQTLARHSTISLTLDCYTHVMQDEQVRAVEALPTLDEGAVG